MPAEVSEGKTTSVSPATPPPMPLPPAEEPAAVTMPPPMPPDESVTHRCANCLTPLAGPFCAQCGQHVADYHRSVWRFVADFFDNVFCWDNKILRTLGPLLKRPGWLTQEFMAGRRVRYVHPLRLFLFTSAICLTLIQYVHHSSGGPHVRVHTGANSKPGASIQFTGNDQDADEDGKTPAATPAAGSTPIPGASASPGPAGTATASPAPAASASPAAPTLGQVFRDTFKDGKPKDAAATEKLAKQMDTLGDNLQKKIDAAGGRAGIR